MPVITMPDGTQLDLGDNPSPETKAALAKKYQEQTAAGMKPPADDSGGVSLSDIKDRAVEYAPEIARTAGPILGGIAGIPGGPAGIAAGAALGGFVADAGAQALEKSRGQRAAYNPWRGIAEAGSDAAFAGIPMGDAILTAVAKAGTLGVVTSTGIGLSEGHLPTAGQAALAFLTAGGLQAIHGMASVKAQAVKEISSVPQIEEHVSVLTSPDAPTHGPDGVPTEIPGATLVDERGRPISRQDVYPEIAGPPAPQVGPPDPAAQIASATETGGGDTKVGQTPVKKATGLNTASRRQQQKQAVLDTWMEQRRPGIFEAQPSKDIPPLESATPSQPLLEEDGGMADLKQQAEDPIHDIPGNGEFDDPSKVTQQGIMRYVGRTKGYFIRLEKDTGFPVYQDYDKLSQANRKFQSVSKDMSNTALKALKGTDRGDWQAMLQDVAAGADGGSLKPKLRAKMETVTNTADRALEPFGITSHDLFTEYLPALNQNAQDTLAQDKWAPFQEALLQGKVNLETSDLPRMMQQITKMGAFESEAAPVVKYLKEKYSASLDAPESVKQAVNFYTSILDGTPDRVSAALGASISHIGDKFGWKIDGDGIANRMVSTQYAAMLAGRPGPVIRRLLHPIQTAVGPMGFSWLAEGYRQFLTAEGRAAVASSGVASESIMRELDATGKTKLGSLVDQGVAWAMTPFGSADLASRGPVYLGTRAKILWAAEKYGDNIDQFLTKSGVGRYSQPEANIILDLVQRGDAAGAADRGAQMMVDNTQFMYSALERPRVFTGVGRFGGAFGVWPAQYGEYLANMANRGANGTWYEVGRDYTRFITGNAAIVGAFYGAAKFVNHEAHLTDTLGWSMVSHALYTGAPGMNAILAGANQIKELTEGRGIPQNREQAKSKAMEVFRTVAAPFIPMSGMGLDIVRASKEPTPARKLSTYAGITRGSPPKDTGFKGYGASKPLKGF